MILFYFEERIFYSFNFSFTCYKLVISDLWTLKYSYTGAWINFDK